jgi:acyl dehydratase
MSLESNSAKNVVDGLPIGRSVRSHGRTIGEGEFSLLNLLIGATSRLHTDQEYMKTTQFGERILGGAAVLAIVAAGWSHCPLYDELIRDYRVNYKAALESGGKFRAAVLPGDTIYGVYTLADARASKSRPGWGVMEIAFRGENQRDEVVIDGALRAMFERVETQ